MTALRIRLVVTGDLERKALVPSIKRFFPSADIYNNPVVWLPPRKAHGATTHRLRRGGAPSKPMNTLARAVLAEALDGADGTPADLVIAVDDLEIHNVDQPDVVCSHFRKAMHTQLMSRIGGASATYAEEARRTIREHCSFHLISPMVESYLFGERDALIRAGCSPGVEPILRSTDCEDFWCLDPAFQPHCTQENANKAAAPLHNSWWREQRHSKRYLSHLIRQHGGFYEETAGGATAMAQLDWPSVPKRAGECALIRSLFADLGDFFGIYSPLRAGDPSIHTYLGTPALVDTRLMRNLR